MEAERCPSCGEFKTLPANLFPGGDGRGVFLSPAGMIGPGFGVNPGGVPILPGFRCCLMCGHLWSHVSPEQLQAFIGARGTKLGKQYLETLQKGPYHDLPDDPLARQAADKVTEIDALMVSWHEGAATRRYREMAGETWDQAIEVVKHWRSRERAAKLALFGWPPEEKRKDKAPDVEAHPMRDRWLDD